MASKKPAPTDDELLAELDSLSTKPTSRSAKASTRPPRQPKKDQQSSTAANEDDLLAELGNLAQRPASRPSTPSLKPTPSNTPAIGGRSPQLTVTATPPTPSAATATNTTGRQSEDKASNGPRKSGDSNRSYHQSFTPATTATEESPEPELQPVPLSPPAQKSGGSWWGGFISTATAAVNQAQAKVKEIQKNEEAQRWAEQVRGNVGALRGFGGELKSLAIPTFQNILQTIAPPISSHERLQIYVTHDFDGYPSLDPLVYAVFSRVMSQVEGGDLMVIQKGSEPASNRDSRELQRPVNSWRDGPWWRSAGARKINAIKGVVEGSKLARAAAEGYSDDFFAQRGGVEAAAKKAAETLNDKNPTRDSEIFLAVQAISTTIVEGLFAAGPSAKDANETETSVKDADADKTREEISFAIYLHDPIHGIAFAAISQAVPNQWVEWLDAPTGGEGVLPESIEGIIAEGGIDPREWVSEWIEETLSLAVGTVAQRYVARRMGVGEAGVRRGKGVMKPDRGAEQTVESGGGEAARAMGGM